MRPRLRAARRHSGELRMILGTVVAAWLTFRVTLGIMDSHAWWRIGMGMVAIVSAVVLAVDGYRIRRRIRRRVRGRLARGRAG
jgi:uncharacterized membrane protein